MTLDMVVELARVFRETGRCRPGGCGEVNFRAGA